MQQVLFAGYYSVLSQADTEYMLIGNGGAAYTVEANRAQVVSTGGTISSLYIELTVAPGSGKSRTFTLRVNGVDTALTCTISNTATSGNDTAHSVAVAAGDVISLKSVPTSTPAASYIQFSTKFTGTTANQSLILGYGGSSTAATIYETIFGGAGAGGATEANSYQIIPTAGKIKNLYVNLTADPGTNPDAYRFTLRVNGVSSTLTCTITADNTTGNDTTHEVTVAAGDYVDLMIEPLNIPSVQVATRHGMTFVANVDGESLILGGAADDLSASATEYNQIAPLAGNYPSIQSDWTATEAARQMLGQVCVLKKLYVRLSGASGVGKSYAFTVRNNAGDTTLTCTLANVTTGSDTTNNVTLAAGDNIALKCVPSGTPIARDAYWGLVCYIAPPVTVKSAPVCFDMAVL